METGANQQVLSELDRLFRTESRYALASLVRLLGDLDLAEDALQEAFAIAADKWPIQGIPQNARSWLISTARFKAVDCIRRESRVTHGLDEALLQARTNALEDENFDEQIEDDLLRLIFLCCHPSLTIEAQVALTLREVCGLTTAEIASAFLISEPSMGQRISRAKAKLRDSRATFESPLGAEREARLDGVLRVIYLVFNEGYYASSGDSLTSADLSQEAIRLGELLARLILHPEVFGLNALMCFSESRREAREADGEIVLLEDQDRSLWNHNLILSGNTFLTQSQNLDNPGPYTIQAQIAAQHANTNSVIETDWAKISQLYQALYSQNPSPVVRLNWAVAVAMSGQIELGLTEISGLIESGQLDRYGLAHAAQADLLRRLGRLTEAKSAYETALSLAQMEPERKFLIKRISEMDFALVPK